MTTTLKSPFNNNCLSGKVALVTGGASGIGYFITEQLLLHGCETAILLGRRETFLQRSSQALSSKTGKRVLYQVCDVRNDRQCAEVMNWAMERTGGRLDILINAAAGNFLAVAEDLKPKGFRTVIEIDTIGTYNMCHTAFPALKRSKGCIINISATLQYGATWFQSHASAAKSAVDSLTRSLALEWGSEGIRVNGIAPGPIADTPGTTKLAPGMTSDDVNEMMQDGIPLQRMGTGFDIAMATVFLSCENSGGYVTGDVLVVDGGHWLYKPPMVPKDMVSELSRKVEKKSRDQRPKL